MTNCSGDVDSVISEAEIAKDVTVLVSRIGDYRSNVKVKWVDFSPFVRGIGEQHSEYRVSFKSDTRSNHTCSYI